MRTGVATDETTADDTRSDETRTNEIIIQRIRMVEREATTADLMALSDDATLTWYHNLLCVLDSSHSSRTLLRGVWLGWSGQGPGCDHVPCTCARVSSPRQEQQKPHSGLNHSRFSTMRQHGISLHQIEILNKVGKPNRHESWKLPNFLTMNHYQRTHFQAQLLSKPRAWKWLGYKLSADCVVISYQSEDCLCISYFFLAVPILSKSSRVEQNLMSISSYDFQVGGIFHHFDTILCR